MHRLKALGENRYVGDVRTMEVHDTWHPDCEGCLPGLIVAEGAGVGFEPDELSQALEEGFECCSWCFGREKDPEGPWTPSSESDHAMPESADPGA
jgi:hypothetical protein